MGGCLSHKQLKTAINLPAQFKIDNQMQKNINHPIPTTLYNLLRKSTQLQIIHATNKQNKIFNKQNYPNLQALTDKDIKLLYSFKNILLINPNSKQGSIVLSKILAVSNPKQIYTLQENQAINFIQKYPIFHPQQPNRASKQLPIYIINSQQIMKKGQKKQIFIHSLNSSNNQIYTKLNIAHVIKYTPQNSIQQITQQLKRCEKQRILLLHSTQIKQQDLFNIFTQYLVTSYEVNLLNAQIYLRRFLPQTAINQQLVSQQISQNRILSQNKIQNKPSTQIQLKVPVPPPIQPIQNSSTKRLISNSQKQTLSNTQIYQKYLQQLYIQLGSNQAAALKLQRSVNLLITLISNIYNNKGSQNYRTVRKKNNQINQLLGKYKNGVKLLNQIGFIDSGGNYVNNVDVKFLKIFRIDLEMGYRMFIDSLKKN